MKYNVRLYPVFRVLVENVEAGSHIEAIETALKEDWHGYPLDFSEEFTCFLVDEVGDAEHEKSRWYMSDGETLCPPAGENTMLDLLHGFLTLYKEHPARGSDWANFHQRVKAWIGVKEEKIDEREHHSANQ